METAVKIENYDGPDRIGNIDIVLDNFKKRMNNWNKLNSAHGDVVEHFVALNIEDRKVPLKVFLKIIIKLLSHKRVHVSVSMQPTSDPNMVSSSHLGGMVRLLETKSEAPFKATKFCTHYRDSGKCGMNTNECPFGGSTKDMSQFLSIGENIPPGTATIRLELELLPLDWDQAEYVHGGGTSDLKRDIAALRKKTDTADVKLICNGRPFLAHKFILSARSDVFAAMFSHKDTKEDKSGEVHINDCDHEAMEIFISYLYGDETPASTTTFEVAKQLLNVANMYKVESLKKTSIKMLLARLDEDNAIEISTLGELFNLSSLDMAAKATISAAKKPLSVLVRESAGIAFHAP